MWGHKVINLLWKEQIEGGGIGRPPNKELHKDGYLSLVYWTHNLLRIDTVVSFPLTCGELSRSGLSGLISRVVCMGTYRMSYGAWWHYIENLYPLVHGVVPHSSTLCRGVQRYVFVCSRA